MQRIFLEVRVYNQKYNRRNSLWYVLQEQIISASIIAHLRVIPSVKLRLLVSPESVPGLSSTGRCVFALLQ